MKKSLWTRLLSLLLAVVLCVELLELLRAHRPNAEKSSR